jgi:hypothetical protein
MHPLEKTLLFMCIIKYGTFSLNKVDLTESDLVKFSHGHSNDYSNMLLKNKHLYLSGTNYVFKLNSLNISDKSAVDYKERSILPTIDLNHNHTSIRERAKNHVKFLGSSDFLNDLIICGTNLGRPHLYDLKMTDLSNQLEYNGNYLCSGVLNETSLGLISYDVNYLKYQSIKKGIMYSAVWHSQESSLENGIFSRYGIYRKEIEFNRNFIKTHSSPHWLWDPQFISVIEDFEFVYYFFSEFSIEEFKKSYPNFNMSSTQNLSDFTNILASRNELTRYSRVARVCKSDKGMSSLKHSFLNNLWTSFRKIKIECKCDGHSVVFSNLILVKVLESNPNKLLGIFYHKYSEKDLEFSVLCEFDIGDLRQKLKTTKFKVDKNQSEFEEDTLKCDQNEEEIKSSITENNNEETDNDTFDDSRDTDEKDLDRFYLFLSENTLLDATFIGTCKNLLPTRVKSVSISSSFIYLFTSNHKVIQVNNDNYEIFTEIDLNSVKIISEILLNEKNNLLYLAALDGVYQIDLDRVKELACNQNEYCSICLVDNFCRWDPESTPSCSSLRESIPRKTIECSSFKISEDYTFKENQTISLKCGNFSRNVIDRIRWYKNDVEVSSSNLNHFFTNKADLILVNINSDIYSGLYTCKIGEKDVIKKISLNVLKNTVITSTSSYSNFDIESFKTLQKNIDDWKNDTKDLKLKLLEFENLVDKTEC